MEPIRDAKFHTEIDKRDDPAIFAVKNTGAGLDTGEKASDASETLKLLGAGKPYGE